MQRICSENLILKKISSFENLINNLDIQQMNIVVFGGSDLLD